jgi:putative molybdopterin biosynthesis protein
MKMERQEFLTVLPPEEAREIFFRRLDPKPLGTEEVPLEDLVGRVLAERVIAAVDLPPFDRAIVDGYAVRAADTYGAAEFAPRQLALLPGRIEAGQLPTAEVGPGQAVAIATGAMIPRGADAVVMVEDCQTEGTRLILQRAVIPGTGIAFAGTDVSRRETVLWPGEVVRFSTVAILAALGRTSAKVFRRPRVAIFSTGSELVARGQPLPPGCIYDANGPMLEAAVLELGCQPVPLGIVPDDFQAILSVLERALGAADVVLLSGGTSKGLGDLSYRAVAQLCRPGIIVHGIAAKPGKPLCLALHEGKAVVILPGFPLSATFTFQEFVAPLLARLAGRKVPPLRQRVVKVAHPLHSEPGRREYIPVRVFPVGEDLVAWPIVKGSGSVSAFNQADGYLVVETLEEMVPAGAKRMLLGFSELMEPPDLTIIGSHCVGVDFLVGKLHEKGYRVKTLAVGSTAGLAAATRKECDLAGIHLLDPQTGRYNEPFLTPDLELIPGYRRMQGIVFRREDARFAGDGWQTILARVVDDPSCRMVNRNQGSGTRILIDRLLGGRRPSGYEVAVNTHHAVVAAVAQRRADWGVAIQWVAEQAGLGFFPLAEEHFDFVAPKARSQRPAVRAFRELLADPTTQRELERFGFRVPTKEGNQ